MKQSIDPSDSANQITQLCLVYSPEPQTKTLLSPKDFRIRKPAPLVLKPMLCDQQEDSQKAVGCEYNFKDLRLGKKIGSGAFGDVFVGFIQGKFIAVKQMDGKQLIESVDNEIIILSKLTHKNIVQYYGYMREAGILNVYLEYMDGGSLSDRLKQFGKFNETLIRKFTIQILDGLIYLHRQAVVHRDLKCGNILSNQRGQIKIADFGSSSWKEAINLSDTEFCQSMKGSFKWMAPELLLKEKKYGRRVDVWSLGCVIIEMATAEHPWPNIKSLAQLLEAIQNLKCPPIPTHLSKECQNFIKRCCTYNKDQRPHAEILKEDPWIKKEI
ncbi:unnamed protein product [Paramecium primaurelia]|uniref:Protein kinase domain-containing protein n=1 Tax=Paramecium primaurelia TaxID=5886 RepID=A0A8S1Q2G4_PARPR|nr:unnamed protein product [Paramecium primaurelia]